MTNLEIFDNLCSYDKRSPYYDKELTSLKDKNDCYCDNCFYGRNELALEIIKLKRKGMSNENV